MNAPYSVLAGRVVGHHVVTTGDDEPPPSAHTTVVSGVPQRTVEAALALYLRAHGHLREVAP